MNARVLVATDDLFFWGRIEGTARMLGCTVARVSGEEGMEEAYRTGGVRRVLVDLGTRSLDILGWARRWKGAPDPPELVAFGSHVDAEAMARAREAGYDRVIPNSRLARELPGFLS